MHPKICWEYNHKPLLEKDFHYYLLVPPRFPDLPRALNEAQLATKQRSDLLFSNAVFSTIFRDFSWLVTAKLKTIFHPYVKIIIIGLDKNFHLSTGLLDFVEIEDFSNLDFLRSTQNLKNLPHGLDVYRVNVKSMREILQIFVCFSESTNFKEYIFWTCIIINSYLFIGWIFKITKCPQDFLQLGHA